MSERKFCVKAWEKKMLEELQRQQILMPVFVPKYSGKNKLILWICRKFKIGSMKYPKIGFHSEGEKIKIRGLTFNNLNEYTIGGTDERV